MSGTLTPPEPLLTVEQVATILGVHKKWVYERAQRGDLPSGKVGRYVRFRRSDVLAFVDLHFGHGPSG